MQYFHANFLAPRQIQLKPTIVHSIDELFIDRCETAMFTCRVELRCQSALAITKPRLIRLTHSTSHCLCISSVSVFNFLFILGTFYYLLDFQIHSLNVVISIVNIKKIMCFALLFTSKENKKFGCDYQMATANLVYLNMAGRWRHALSGGSQHQQSTKNGESAET